ncbi:aspartate 1-decarboxylase [Candidatus Sumerlaeota bacterium]|nr:aspartate 1-decarboxylase [Candidatus Sumerlaeota bacterium]
MRVLLKSKIHRATVTDADLNYEGSITIDPELLEVADMLPHEQAHVFNINNGERFVTYIMEGKPGSREMIINGAAARKAMKGDLIIVVTYVHLDEEAACAHRPRVVVVDENNNVKNSQ